MRKYFIIILTLLSAVVVMPFPAIAETAQDDEYPDLEQVRRKAVRMKKEIDRFMKDIMETYPSDIQASGSGFGQAVNVDMSQNDREMIVRADLPGMSKDKIEITLENGKTLKIAGSRDVAVKETSPGVVRQERAQGRFERILELPQEGLSEGIKASYKDGVLEVSIPKKAKTKEELVKIKVT